jgi:hypothetical protein
MLPASLRPQRASISEHSLGGSGFGGNQQFYALGFAATEVQVSRLTKLLGQAPRSYEDFAMRQAAEWAK